MAVINRQWKCVNGKTLYLNFQTKIVTELQWLTFRLRVHEHMGPMGCCVFMEKRVSQPLEFCYFHVYKLRCTHLLPLIDYHLQFFNFFCRLTRKPRGSRCNFVVVIYTSQEIHFFRLMATIFDCPLTQTLGSFAITSILFLDHKNIG